MQHSIILASQSPRRREIMGYFSLPCEPISPDFDEAAIPFSGDPEEYVATLARGKAASLSERYKGRIILAADTTVYHGGKVYGKPADEHEAFSMLCELAGTKHSVYTGVAIKRDDEEYCGVEETVVHFHRLTADQIRRYHHLCHCRDKAGGYAIQEAGSIIVRRIEGCFYNVMGLPLNTVHDLLKQAGIDLWDYIKEQ